MDDQESIFMDHFSETDPLNLADKIMGSQELANLRRRNVVQFYKRQNSLIQSLLQPSIEDQSAANEEENKQRASVRLAVRASFLANAILLAMQLVAAILTGSLSLYATLADAVMDIASSGILYLAEKAAAKDSNHKYPTGRSRMLTAGVIVFASLMATLSVQLIAEAIRAIIAQKAAADLSVAALILIASAVCFKAILYLYCRLIKNSSVVAVLAQDHRNDVLLNTVGLGFSVLATYYHWWLDPMGALLIAFYILFSWAHTAYEHVLLIVGKTANVEFLQKITYVAMTHDSRVLQVDTARAYHAGANFFVEVDIVLPPEMSLHEAHDIGEALQVKLENMPMVERAFVHLDYETSHAPEHRKTR